MEIEGEFYEAGNAFPYYLKEQGTKPECKFQPLLIIVLGFKVWQIF